MDAAVKSEIPRRAKRSARKAVTEVGFSKPWTGGWAKLIGCVWIEVWGTWKHQVH